MSTRNFTNENSSRLKWCTGYRNCSYAANNVVRITKKVRNSRIFRPSTEQGSVLLITALRQSVKSEDYCLTVETIGAAVSRFVTLFR